MNKAAYGVCVSVLGAMLAGGCKHPAPFELEGSGVRATYYQGTLWCDLPSADHGGHDMETVRAAAVAGLRSRGYVIGDRRGVLREPAEVVGQLAGADSMQEAVVRIRSTVPGTRVEVRVEPFGNDDEGRAIMRAVLARLGYEK